MKAGINKNEEIIETYKAWGSYATQSESPTFKKKRTINTIVKIKTKSAFSIEKLKPYE
tara:strand:- start:47 stop:220 length:174 start_codon:yes stop_codon:yes gene_type:complete